MADRNYTGVADAAGALTITITTGTRERVWVVTQVSARVTTAPIGATCELRKNGAFVTPIIATGDVASGDPPIELQGYDVMTVVWAGLTPGSAGEVYIVYDEVSRGGVRR